MLLANFGLLGRDVQRVAYALVQHLHLNPAKRLPQVFLEAASHVDDRGLLMLA